METKREKSLRLFFRRIPAKSRRWPMCVRRMLFRTLCSRPQSSARGWCESAASGSAAGPTTGRLDSIPGGRLQNRGRGKDLARLKLVREVNQAGIGKVNFAIAIPAKNALNFPGGAGELKWNFEIYELRRSR